MVGSPPILLNKPDLEPGEINTIVEPLSSIRIEARHPWHHLASDDKAPQPAKEKVGDRPKETPACTLEQTLDDIADKVIDIAQVVTSPNGLEGNYKGLALCGLLQIAFDMGQAR